MLNREPFSRNLRASQRYPTDFLVVLGHGDQLHRAAVKDLSSGGALLECDATLPVGSPVSVRARDLNVEATVVRAAAQNYGVQFIRPVDALAVIRQNVAELQHFRTMRAYAASLQSDKTVSWRRPQAPG